MVAKNVVIPLETEYLESCAKVRGISRTRLVQIIMERVIEDKLVRAILKDADKPYKIMPVQKYRRFPEGPPKPTKPHKRAKIFYE